MNLFLQELVAGVSLAGIYALLSVSITFAYGMTRIVLLAQGDIMVIGTYAGFFVALKVPNLALAIFVGLIASTAIGGLTYEAIFRWFRDGSHLPPLVAGLALSVVIEEALRLSFYGGQPVAFPATVLPGLTGTQLDLVIAGIALVVGGGFEALLKFTRMGRAMRGCADDRSAARQLGVRVDRMQRVAFYTASGLAGAAGVLVALVYQYVSPYTGSQLEFVALACILVGGMGSITGAVVGSLIVGVGQAFIGTYISSSYEYALVFGIVLLVLVFKPVGLFGTESTVRA